MRLDTPLDLAPGGCNQQRSNQVDPLVVLDLSAYGGRLAPRRPRAWARTHHRKTTFIHENQGRAEVTPLFLSLARCSASSAQWRRRRATAIGVEAFDNSSPCASEGATPNWG